MGGKDIEEDRRFFIFFVFYIMGEGNWSNI